MNLAQAEQVARAAVKRAQDRGETNTDTLNRLYYAAIAAALITQKEAA